MKRILSIALMGVLVCVGVASATVTQTATNSIAADLPRDKFYEKIGQAVHDLCETDIPAIITSLNAQAGTNEVVTECKALSNAVLQVYASNVVVKSGGTVTVPAGSVTPLAIAGGTTGTKTNAGTGYTNLWHFYGGVLTNVSFTGAMP